MQQLILAIKTYTAHKPPYFSYPLHWLFLKAIHFLGDTQTILACTKKHQKESDVHKSVNNSFIHLTIHVLRIVQTVNEKGAHSLSKQNKTVWSSLCHALECTIPIIFYSVMNFLCKKLLSVWYIALFDYIIVAKSYHLLCAKELL